MDDITKDKRSRIINFLVTEEEFKQIKQKATKYAKGRHCTWVRFAAMNYDPMKKATKSRNKK